MVDDVTLVFHPGPFSYTGEDLAEIGCHGNPIVVRRILDIIGTTALARPAGPGEFTRRAFLNGKMDLVQAEAVGALIDASTDAGCTMARSLMSGVLSAAIGDLRDRTARLLADIEASFITDEEGPDAPCVASQAAGIAQEIRSLASDARLSRTVYAGIVTTIAGLPNVGKSSLFNALVGHDRAIVHEEAGTTRDILTERVCIDGLDFVFHDTAGIRTAASGPEKAGIERAMKAIENSDLLLYVVDARAGIRPHERRWLGLSGTTIVVMNKMDLVDACVPDDPEYPTVRISAIRGTGMDGLVSLMAGAFCHNDPRAVFIERHACLLSTAASHLESCARVLGDGLTMDIAASELDRALDALARITGEAADDDILERVFGRFCIGK